MKSPGLRETDPDFLPGKPGGNLFFYLLDGQKERLYNREAFTGFGPNLYEKG